MLRLNHPYLCMKCLAAIFVHRTEWHLYGASPISSICVHTSRIAKSQCYIILVLHHGIWKDLLGKGIETINTLGRTSLHMAAAGGHAQLLRALLDAGNVAMMSRIACYSPPLWAELKEKCVNQGPLVLQKWICEISLLSEVVLATWIRRDVITRDKIHAEKPSICPGRTQSRDAKSSISW